MQRVIAADLISRQGLSVLVDAEMVEALRIAATDPDRQARRAAGMALGTIDLWQDRPWRDTVIDTILGLMRADDAYVRYYAVCHGWH